MGSVNSSMLIEEKSEEKERFIQLLPIISVLPKAIVLSASAGLSPSAILSTAAVLSTAAILPAVSITPTTLTLNFGNDFIPLHKIGKLNIISYDIPTKKGSNSNWKDSKLSVLDLCHCANIAYEGRDKTKIPNGWIVLTTAKNEADGYHGVAFWNEEHQHLVIAHSGTNNWEGWKTDFKSVLLNKYSSQIHSSCEFALHLVNDFNNKRECRITITGHSLGGYEAQISAFAVKHLTVDMKNTRKKCRESPTVVAFDSPGCLKMLIKLYKDYFNYSKEKAISSIKDFDITTYILEPNLVNCATKHAGVLKLYASSEFGRVWDSEEDEEKNLQLMDMIVPLTSKSHNINNFILALGERIEERFVKVETSRWLLIEKKKMFLYLSVLSTSPLMPFLPLMNYETWILTLTSAGSFGDN